MPTYQLVVSIAELEQFFPPVKKGELPRSDWSVVDFHVRRLNAGAAMDISILRSRERGLSTLGCALQLTTERYAVVCITDNDPMLSKETFRIEGAPRLKLHRKLDESEWERLGELVERVENGTLLKKERDEYARLVAVACLMAWHSRFSEDEDLKSIKSLLDNLVPQAEESVAADK